MQKPHNKLLRDLEIIPMWHEQLINLFRSLGQDTIHEAIEYMDANGTLEERKGWLDSIEKAISAAENNDHKVVEIINASGYRISKPIEAREYFIELGYLYLKQCLNETNT